MNTEHEKGILLMRANSTVKGLRLEHLLQGCFAGEEKFWILSALARSVRGSRQGSRLPKHTSCSCAFATAVTPCTARDVAQDFWQELSQKHRKRA